MSELLNRDPFGPRDDVRFLAEMNELTEHHRRGCPAYARIAPPGPPAETVEQLPFLHVGLFKELRLATEYDGVTHGRTLQSSATSGRQSQVVLDARSSALQARSSAKILRSLLGDAKRPLLILDNARSVRQRGVISARTAAALSLQPLASELLFLLDEDGSMRWSELERALGSHDDLLVYGFSWILWTAWGRPEIPERIREALGGKRVAFVHSGGWKKLAAESVERDRFDGALLDGLHPDSLVLDYYGLVEQVGLIYPLCDRGVRHVPVWADVVVRDSHSGRAVVDSPGQLQLMNTLAWGAPYHSVLTEDVGLRSGTRCDCGRDGRTFRLIGRLPKSEVRGCANV